MPFIPLLLMFISPEIKLSTSTLSPCFGIFALAHSRISLSFSFRFFFLALSSASATILHIPPCGTGVTSLSVGLTDQAQFQSDGGVVLGLQPIDV
ncbi:MAG: hypothetical protein ACK5KP_08490 [Paludibacteraceae bacterium]